MTNHLNRVQFFSYIGFLSFACIGAFGLPSFTLTNQTGSQNPWLADFWVPLGEKGKNHFFTDFQGSYSSDQGNGAINMGVIDRRTQVYDTRVFGGYVYGEYNRSPLGLNFGTINPGIEFLTNHWHVSLNAYIPVTANTQKAGQKDWADEFGVYQYIQFQGHDQFNQMLQPSETTGVGTDLIGSYSISKLHNTSVTLGTYYFNTSKHPLGVVAAITTPRVRHLSFDLAYNHNPLTSNSVLLSASFHLGENQSDENNWINEPVQHNAIMFGQANTIPFVEKLNPVGSLQLQRDNVWFFDSNGVDFNPSLGVQNCTYEHPCGDLNNEVTEEIGGYSRSGSFEYNPSLYVKTGTYNFDPGYILDLFDNESLIGRNSDYTQPARGDDRPIFNLGSLLIDGRLGNEENSIENLQLQNPRDDGPAVIVFEGNNVEFNDLKIGSSNLDLGYGGGFSIEDSHHVVIKNSEIWASNHLISPSYGASGIFADHVSDLRIDGTTINVQGEGVNGVASTAIWLTGGSTVSVDNSTLTSSISGDHNEGTTLIYSDSGAPNHLVINHSHLSARATGDSTSAYLVQASGSSDMTIENSSLDAEVSSVGSNEGVFGFSLSGSARANLLNSTLNTFSSSSSGRAASTNFSMTDNSQAYITNSDLNSNAHSELVTGNTNISVFDDAEAFVRGSHLQVAMTGGPSTGEPSGAINVWSLNQSRVNVDDSVLEATSGNDVTNAVNLQSQNDSQITVNRSTLSMNDPYGNATSTPSTSVIAVDDSHIEINHALISASVNGVMSANLQIMESFDRATIDVADSQVQSNNQAHAPGGGAVKTIGAYAAGNSIISLHNVMMHLIGEDTEDTATSGSGQVIVT